MLDKTIEIMRTFVENPYTNLIIGMILFGSGLSEAWNTFNSNIAHMNEHKSTSWCNDFRLFQYAENVFRYLRQS